MTYCNTIVEHSGHLEAGFSSKKTLMCSMRQAFWDRAKDGMAINRVLTDRLERASFAGSILDRGYNSASSGQWNSFAIFDR